MTGSTNNYVGNNVYDDLIMTKYPEFLDTRDAVTGNRNLLRRTNLVDYNLAEDVNALQDAVLAIEKTLGEQVQLPVSDATKTAVEKQASMRNNTVKTRLDSIETHDWTTEFDKRYGGPTWTYDPNRDPATNPNPTIQQHKHTGATVGMPSKISLTAEVTGKLPKDNINLTKTSGITGADLYVHSTAEKTISDSLDDVVSESTGGTIASDTTLTILGKTNTRWTREFDSSDSTASRVQDTKSSFGWASENANNSAQTLLQKSLTGMYYGQYVAIVRLSCNNLSIGNVAQITAGGNTITLKGSDFDTSGAFKNFFLVFGYNQATELKITKLVTTTAAKIRFDYAVVEPVHPAIFDK